MCITFLYTNLCDKTCRYKLILVNNRDEFFARITLKAELSESAEKLRTIHGTDVEAIEHGTWLGLSQRGEKIRIGNLLNVTGEERKHGVKGRGAICVDFIKDLDRKSAEQFNKQLLQSSSDYNGFNFLSVELNRKSLAVFNVCNADQTCSKLPLGYIGISNSPLSLPYQKVTVGTEKFRELVQEQQHGSTDTFIDALLNFLKCEEKHLPCQELAKRRPHDAHIFSSIHVKHTSAQYGTRNRSVILVDHLHNVDFVEERMVNENPESPDWQRQSFRLPGRSPSLLECLATTGRLLGRLRAML